METINDRLRQVRKSLRLKQDEFGEVLGITRGGVCDIEAGRRNVTDQHILMLSYYKEKPINIDWLKTGEGEMFKTVTRNQALMDFFMDVLKDDDDDFRKKLFAVMADLTVEDWKKIERMVDRLTKKE